ncbi:hypothetical protein [Caenimonas aquaedulcis]|uniref:Uncharacterized protein n=1 Tax=Caenimonas aquaedulcis TaxID=2793270 RepID=A0A931MHL3_9BURK|nr:hypothetical protein [Caenimonas aquaedulcis]MBG9389191.1 hypothetical protein [Caenimonas aquaedulcis]
MTRELILFAGLHKTGTTSIQETARQHGGALRRAGYWYPVFNDEGEEIANHTRLVNLMFKQAPHLVGLGNQFVWSEPVDTGLERQTLRNKVAMALRDAPRAVLVAEGVSVLQPEELAQLHDWLAGQGWTVRVICHVRHLSSWLNSIVSQRVTAGIRLPIAGVIDEFLRHAGGVVRPRVEALRAAFPQTEFHSHESAVRHAHGPVGFFLETIGFQPGPRFRFVRANEGRSDAATRALSLLNERFGLFHLSGEKNAERFDGARTIAMLYGLPGRKFTLRPAEAAPLMPMLRAENEWLRDTLGPQFHDGSLETAFIDQPVEWRAEALNQFAAALARMPEPVRAWMTAHLDRLGVPEAQRGRFL